MTYPIAIGPHQLNGRAVLAPMAGLTDQPFRHLCRKYGAAMTVSEMTTSDTGLWHTRKSRERLTLSNEDGLKIVQIAGSEPARMRDAAIAAVALGADVVDINMGCPAKKVCNKLAGSALLKSEELVRRILEAVVDAVEVPVTLKMRTGWHPDHRNGVRIAQIAEASGIKALAVHGRTRACKFSGAVEYDTLRDIKLAVSVPVFANGDINDIHEAEKVLRYTGADGVMIGRGALGRPWIFSQLCASLAKKDSPNALSMTTRRDIILDHLDALYNFYGKERGVRVARKHLTWYCRYLEGAGQFREIVVRVDKATDQLRLTREYFDGYQDTGEVAGDLQSLPGVREQCLKQVLENYPRKSP